MSTENLKKNNIKRQYEVHGMNSGYHGEKVSLWENRMTSGWNTGYSAGWKLGIPVAIIAITLLSAINPVFLFLTAVAAVTFACATVGVFVGLLSCAFEKGMEWLTSKKSATHENTLGQSNSKDITEDNTKDNSKDSTEDNTKDNSKDNTEKNSSLIHPHQIGPVSTSADSSKSSQQKQSLHTPSANPTPAWTSKAASTQRELATPAHDNDTPAYAPTA